MESGLIEMFTVSLTLTLAVELAVAFMLERAGKPRRGKRWGREMLLVVLANVLTNPPAVLLCWIGGLYLPRLWEIPVQLMVEAGVMVVEACIYQSFAHLPRWEIRRPVLLAVAANLCSWLTGVIV